MLCTRTLVAFTNRVKYLLQITSIDDDTDSKNREMFLLNLQSLDFLNKKTLFLDYKKFRLAGQTSILLKISGCIQPPSLEIRCIFCDFDLYKTQKTHENTREGSLHNISVILSAV